MQPSSLTFSRRSPICDLGMDTVQPSHPGHPAGRARLRRASLPRSVSAYQDPVPEGEVLVHEQPHPDARGSWSLRSEFFYLVPCGDPDERRLASSARFALGGSICEQCAGSAPRRTGSQPPKKGVRPGVIPESG